LSVGVLVNFKVCVPPIPEITVQKNLFDDDTPAQGTVTSIAVAGGSRALSREQKQFNLLIAKINNARGELARWRAFIPELQKRHIGEVSPLLKSLREKRLALARIYDSAMAGTALNKKERRKLIDMLQVMVQVLIAEEETPELVGMFNRYSDIGYEESREMESELMQAFASDVFGVKLGAEDMRGTPEEIAARVQEKVIAKETRHAERRAGKAARADQRNPKAAAREAQQTAAHEQAAQAATKSVREIYRKLASELHPDREPDPVERERKTALMQRANKAHEEGDLLTLLELQLELEQITLADLPGMAREKLLHFNRVLTEQLQRLLDELEEITAPMSMLMNGGPYGEISLKKLRQSIDTEIAELNMTLRALDSDLVNHTDTAKLKRWLKEYVPPDSAMDEMMGEMAMMAFLGDGSPGGAKRTRRKRR